MVNCTTNFENSIISIERIKEFCETPHEVKFYQLIDIIIKAYN